MKKSYFLSVIFFSSSAFAFETKKFWKWYDGIEGKEVTQMYLMGFTRANISFSTDDSIER